jgi:hypothetical protein
LLLEKPWKKFILGAPEDGLWPLAILKFGWGGPFDLWIGCDLPFAPCKPTF